MIEMGSIGENATEAGRPPAPRFAKAPPGPGAGSPLLRVLGGVRVDPPPVWLMRQAGRHLPEYRAVRASAGSFLDLCYAPEFAAEVTLQPVRRYGLDGAIIFSDILVVPDALGQGVRFVEGEGPRLDALSDGAAAARLRGRLDLDRLAPVYEAVRRVRAALPPEVALLGFCGAPWTVAGYMIAGRGTPDLAPSRAFAYADPEGFRALLDLLAEASVDHLAAQLDAGADAVQVFESHAGAIPEAEFEAWCLAPIRRIVAGVRARRPGARVIVFARGAGSNHARVAPGTGADAVGIDWATDLDWTAAHVQPHAAVQGAVDPLALVAGGAALDAAVDRSLEAFRAGPHVFNLGHGVVPQTPPEHVVRLLARVRRTA